MTDKFWKVIATLALIVALGVAIFGHSTKTIQVPVSAASSATTNLPSLGLATLDVGAGCDQQYTNCTPTLSVTTGTTTFGAQNAPAAFVIGGADYAEVEQTFTTATNTPIIIRPPFGTSATSTFGWSGIQVQITDYSHPAMEFDIATTSLSNFATTTQVLVKDVSVGLNSTYDGTFYPIQATTTATGSGMSGVIIGNDAKGATTWFLRPSEGIMLKIASTSVAQSYTGTVSITFKKP